MATVVRSFAIQGIDGYPVDIEVKMLEGQPVISIIGLGDQAVKEAAERIQAAIDESGYVFPKKRVIISLAPSDKKKSGSHFDLAMAVGVLCQNGDIGVKKLPDYGFIGELSLDGRLRACRGILPMIIAGQKRGMKKIIVPEANLKEASLVHGVEILGFHDLTGVIRHLEGKSAGMEKHIEEDGNILDEADRILDFKDVKGQDELIEAVVLAAAGGHNMLMVGEPGCGKTMIAQRIPTILPEMTEEECLEVTKIYSISGLLPNGHALMKYRPFRAPHHNASLNALIGGGANAMPGEVSLAHNGVLFLDELPEFARETVEALRQPLEEGAVHLVRLGGSYVYPADFMLAAAMNPCPCGYYPDMQKCRCTQTAIHRYLERISQPILDRIDICVEAPALTFGELTGQQKEETSAAIQKRVAVAQDIQRERYRKEAFSYNSQIPATKIREYCALDKKQEQYMEEIYGKLQLTARSYHKLLRVARTLADMDGGGRICDRHLEEAICYRSFDRKFWER